VNKTSIPQPSSEKVENPVQKNLKKRWEKRRKAATKQRLCQSEVQRIRSEKRRKIKK